MTIFSRGHVPEDKAPGVDQLAPALDLLLGNEFKILQRRDYFFVHPACAWCSWPYISGDGPLFLGYLLTGWQLGTLTETCVDCGSRVLVVNFGGSPLSGSNSWSGLCECCRVPQCGRGSDHFRRRFDFVMHMRKNFPSSISTWEEYDGFNFSWGGTGLEPARKKRLVERLTANPVSFDQLLVDLSCDNLKPADPPNISLLNEPLKLKFTNR